MISNKYWNRPDAPLGIGDIHGVCPLGALRGAGGDSDTDKKSGKRRCQLPPGEV